MQCFTRASSMRSRLITITRKCVTVEKQKYISQTDKQLEENNLLNINEIKLLGRVSSNPIKEKTNIYPIVHFMLATRNHYIDSEGDKQVKIDRNKICIYDPALQDQALELVKKDLRVYVTGKIADADIQMADGVVDTETIVVAEAITCLKY